MNRRRALPPLRTNTPRTVVPDSTTRPLNDELDQPFSAGTLPRRILIPTCVLTLSHCSIPSCRNFFLRWSIKTDAVVCKTNPNDSVSDFNQLALQPKFNFAVPNNDVHNFAVEPQFLHFNGSRAGEGDDPVGGAEVAAAIQCDGQLGIDTGQLPQQVGSPVGDPGLLSSWRGRGRRDAFGDE